MRLPYFPQALYDSSGTFGSKFYLLSGVDKSYREPITHASKRSQQVERFFWVGYSSLGNTQLLILVPFLFHFVVLLPFLTAYYFFISFHLGFVVYLMMKFFNGFSKTVEERWWATYIQSVYLEKQSEWVPVGARICWLKGSPMVFEVFRIIRQTRRLKRHPVFHLQFCNYNSPKTGKERKERPT